MRYELKITLPIYKILYSLAFMVIIVLVSPINSFSGINTAVEPNVALLASVFMADNYYKEYVGERVAVFYRYPIRKKYISMLVRTLLSWLYLLILVAVFYWGFVWWYQPSNFSQIPIWKMYADTLAACAASMFFAGVFSFTVTNAIQKIGIGIGVTFFLWLFLTSTMANVLPQPVQLFRIIGSTSQLGVLEPDYRSRVFYILMGAVLLVLNWLILQIQPGSNTKKGWMRYGNKH